MLLVPTRIDGRSAAVHGGVPLVLKANGLYPEAKLLTSTRGPRRDPESDQDFPAG
jgi:hypothetical protein